MPTSLQRRKKQNLKNIILQVSGKSLSDFVSRVALYDFIKPNLFYDAATSTSSQEQMIEEISINRGLVQEGELIISQGEIVDDDKIHDP